MIKTVSKLDLPVEVVMTKQLHVARLGDRMIDVRQMMTKFHIRHLPVMDGEILVGIISMTDLQRMSFSETFGEEELDIDDAVSNSFSAEIIMHRNPETIDASASIRDAMEILVNREFHALPVMNYGALVGIVTTTDLLKYFLKE